MDGQQIKQILQDNKERLFTTYPLVSMALFGSFADGSARDDSDVDILVEFSRPTGFELVDLTLDIEQLLHRKADVVTRKAVKPALMQFIQPQLQYV